ncbi:hypothetical protein [Bacillus halotolerans]|uniref:hypothetical protein n=1 Tax=Bacillus halotolerans TaxID=260554 RepID=UPI002DBA01A1|nr:hypothetical protein [Bacillus halotolerans]MEC1405441.1 hypothetical protein [Bacillus halotolerans]
MKDQLIEEWEKNTDQTWSIYSEDVISKKTGEPLRKKGDKYDAHHIIETVLRENMSGGIFTQLSFLMSINLVFMGRVHLLMNYSKEVNNCEI